MLLEVIIVGIGVAILAGALALQNKCTNGDYSLVPVTIELDEIVEDRDLPYRALV